jgi:Domain of unknown function (DUF4149)
MGYHFRMNLLRFMMFLALSAWLGALIFFPVVAQTAFSALPSPHLAGLVVRGSLLKLHCIGLVCGVLFLLCSLIHERITRGRSRVFAARNILVALMIALTAVSQWRIIPRMDALQALVQQISSLVASDPVRAQFDYLHAWSVRIEQAVLVLGLVVLFSVVRRS